MALQRARFSAAHARRQYDAVDPANRSVAGELERRWNEALQVAHRIEGENHARHRSALIHNLGDAIDACFQSRPTVELEANRKKPNACGGLAYFTEDLRPDNPLAQAPYLMPPLSLTNPSGIAALNAEATRQAAMVAYIDDFKLMVIIIVVALPLLLMFRGSRAIPGTATVASD